VLLKRRSARRSVRRSLQTIRSRRRSNMCVFSAYVFSQYMTSESE
jgi:hypothetical protein